MRDRSIRHIESSGQRAESTPHRTTISRPLARTKEATKRESRATQTRRTGIEHITKRARLTLSVNRARQQVKVARAGIEPATFRFSGGRSYQLSYLAAGTRSECHTRNAGYLRRLLATLTGLEPATSAVTGRRANQLRHRAMLCYQRSMDRTPYGIRTRATALKGRRPRPLDEGGSSRISPDRLSTAVRWELG